jgi:hypothetical protein
MTTADANMNEDAFEDEYEGPYRFMAEYTDTAENTVIMVGTACQYWGDAYDAMCDAMTKLKEEYGDLPAMTYRFVGTLDETRIGAPPKAA